MAKTQAKFADQKLQPLPAPAARTEDPTTATPEKVSKVEAVRRALAAGVTNPTAAAAWIGEKFDIDITPQTVSTNKHEIQKGQRKATGTHTPARNPNPTPTPTLELPAGKHESPLELAKQVKQLVQTFGANRVVEMVEVLKVFKD